MSIRFVVSDLDDTLLNDQVALSPLTVNTLATLQHKGIATLLASGRMVTAMMPFVRQLGVCHPFIAGNGAQIVDWQTAQPMYEDTIPLALAQEALAMMGQAGCYTQLYEGEHFLCEAPCAYSRDYAQGTGMAALAVGPLLSYLKGPTPKILGIDHADRIGELLPLFQQHFAGRLSVTRSKGHFLEITNLTATKGHTLLELMRRLSIAPDEIIAFGDGANDVTLLQTAGTSVAMGNAVPEAKAAATHVGLTNAQDGVARFLIDYFAL